MGYREHPADAALSPWLECAWEREGDGDTVRVVPDGCIDVVWTEGAGTALVGPNTTAFLVPVPAGTRVLGARMRPGGAGVLLGVHPPALRDARVDIGEALGDEGRRLAEALDAAPDGLRVLCTHLAGRVRGAARPDPLVAAAVARMTGPEPSVAGAARALHVSERQLRRRVVDAVGYGPKRLARVLRLARALEAARAHDGLARAAAAAGYADAAHLSADCRALAGVPPSRLLGRGREDVRFPQDAAGRGRHPAAHAR